MFENCRFQIEPTEFSIYFIFDFRLAPVLIREITRRVNCKGTFQAVYTAGVVLPKPVATCRYWHRSSSSHVFTIPDFFFTKFCFVFLQVRSFLLQNADITVYHKRKTLCSPL